MDTTATVGRQIPDDFCGFSYETKTLLPDDKGIYYFRADNRPLVQMFRTLGIKSLRIGGNTADRLSVPVPSERDIDSLFAFAKAADVKVTFTMRLTKGGDPASAAAMAKYIMNHYADRVHCFAIGNEPNAINSFTSDYKVFVEAFRKYTDAILAVAPNAKFCGPSATGGATAWVRDFPNDFPDPKKLLYTTYHYYPGGNAAQINDPAAGRRKLLAPEILKSYEKLADTFVPAVQSKGFTYRLEECNSFYNGGRKDASDTQAAALWALEFLYWWASQGCAGINFHTGDYVAREAENTKCNYAAFWSTDAGYDAHPLSYGIEAFQLGHAGRMTPVDITSNQDKVNLSAYAVLGADQTLDLTLLNKSCDSDARTVDVTITTSRAFGRGEFLRLTSPENNIANTSGILLGGASIKEDGNWNGEWQKMAAPAADGSFVVQVPPASAAILRLHI